MEISKELAQSIVVEMKKIIDKDLNFIDSNGIIIASTDETRIGTYHAGGKQVILRKDIIKIEGGLDLVDLDVIGFIDHNITVNIIKNGEIVGKKSLSLPKQITNVIRCKNPRCITSIEQELDQVFVLSDPEKQVYRCKYCEEKYTGK